MVSPTESAGAIDGASPQSPSEPVNGTTPNHLPKNDHLPSTNGGVTPSDEKKTPTGFKSPPKQDPVKQKEREERVRMLREKQAEEQRKKLEELREAQRRAQEIREKQLQERQRKILEQRRREEEHRALVEERRRRMEHEENEKRMALLKKNAERESKLEAARQMGQVNLRHRTPPPNYRVRGNQSENSSGEHSPVRKRRPHSIAGRLPGYAAPTSASQARLGRSEEKKITATSLIAAKNRSKSADVSTMRVSRSSQDIKRSIDRLSMPKVPRESRDRSMPNRAAPKATTPVTPPVKLQPAVPRALPRETTKAPAPKDKNKQPTPQKGPVKANHNVNVSTAKKTNRPSTPQKRSTPSPKLGSPAKEKATPPGTSPAVSPPPASSPVPGEEKKDEEKKVDKEEEYKAKMAAKRKEMREKAEREAEEKRLREEEERRLEEERIQKEEEEERQRIAEEERLAREARKAEEERLQKAIEENERRQREEEEKAEEERKAREEAEKLAKEEAERKEIERVEKLKKEEEERQERRKRLEMIMNRVRPDQEKSDSPSPTKSVSPPSATTPDRELPPNLMNASMTASGSFKSPLLQQMMSKKAQAETGQEQAAEDAEPAPAEDSPVQAEPESDTAVVSETPEADKEEAVAEAQLVEPEEPAVVQQPEATTEVEQVEEQAPVEAPESEPVTEPEPVAEPEVVAEPEPVPETTEEVETAETKEQEAAQESVTTEEVVVAEEPVTNGDVESHDAPQSDNSSPAKGSPAHSPRDSNNTSTSVSLDVSPNSSAPASPKHEGASSTDEGAADKAERPTSPGSEEPKFKSPLLQRMIGNKEKSATRALEEMRGQKDDSTTSSTSSSPVPPKEEADAEQSGSIQVNSDIAELNQVSVEINSGSVPTLNGVNHTQEDLNEVSKSICDVNQKKEDISEFSDKENIESFRYDDEQDEDINIEELKLKFDVDRDDLESVKRRAFELGESSGEAEGPERRGSRREYTSSGSSSPSQSPKKYMRSDASSPRESIPSDDEADDAVLRSSAEHGALLDFTDIKQAGQAAKDLFTTSMTSNRDDLLKASPYDGDDEAASKNPFVTGEAFKVGDEEDGKQGAAMSAQDLDPFGVRECDNSLAQGDDPWKQFASQGQDLMSMSMAAQEKSFPDDLADKAEDLASSGGSSHPFADPWGAAFGGQKVSVDFNLLADKRGGDHADSGLGFSDKLQAGWQTEYGQPPESAMDVDSPAGGDGSFGKIQSEMYRRHFEDEEEEEEEEEVESDEAEEREGGVDNSAKAPTSSLLLNEDPDLINRNQQPAPLNTEPLDENNASTISAAAAKEDNVQEILSL